MTPFRTVTGRATAMLENDVNTDDIAPGMGGPPRLHSNYAGELFRNRRLLDDGQENPDFVLNHPDWRAPTILVVGRNFGCGSSRETAVWAMRDSGIGCIVARSFADSYRENCLKNALLPVVLAPDLAETFEQAVLADGGAGAWTADLAAQAITAPDGTRYPFDFDPSEKEVLLHGLDDIAQSERFNAQIDAWEAATRAARPWLQDVGPLGQKGGQA